MISVVHDQCEKVRDIQVLCYYELKCIIISNSVLKI